jgi:hypothetical protein
MTDRFQTISVIIQQKTPNKTSYNPQKTLRKPLKNKPKLINQLKIEKPTKTFQNPVET